MSVKRNILAGWVAHLIIMVIGFFLMPYILTTVGDAQYGAWLLINAVASYSGVIYAGFGATICRYTSDLSAREDWGKLNSIVSSVQFIYFNTAFLVILLTGVVMYFAPSISDWDGLPLADVRLSMAIVGAGMALGMACSIYGGVLIGVQRIDVVRGIEVICGLSRLALVLICLQTQYGLVTLAWIFFAITVVENLASAYFAYRAVPTLRVIPWRMNPAALQECIGFSAFNGIALVAEYLIFFTDTVVIGVLLGPSSVVVYQIGQRISQMIQVPILQVGQAILPKAGELNATQKHEALAILIAKAMGISLLFSAGFLIGASYFGSLFIETWIGTLYPHSSSILIVLVAAQVVGLPMMIVRKALVGIGNVRVTAFIDIIEAVLNLALSLILLHWIGIVGVALGTFIPLFVVELGIFLPYATRQLSLTSGQLLKRVVLPQIPPLVALWAFCHVSSSYVTTVGWLPLLVVTSIGGGILISVRFVVHLIERRNDTIELPQTTVKIS